MSQQARHLLIETLLPLDADRMAHVAAPGAEKWSRRAVRTGAPEFNAPRYESRHLLCAPSPVKAMNEPGVPCVSFNAAGGRANIATASVNSDWRWRHARMACAPCFDMSADLRFGAGTGDLRGG